jgi:hypothetical protein
MLIYGLIAVTVASKSSFSFMAVAEAVPLAVSALVLGFFSVLFWALNYVSRERKVALRIEEASALFKIRQTAIDEVLPDSISSNKVGIAVLKAHLLVAIDEIPKDVEVPGDGLSFDYSEAVKAVLKK